MFQECWYKYNSIGMFQCFVSLHFVFVVRSLRRNHYYTDYRLLVSFRSLWQCTALYPVVPSKGLVFLDVAKMFGHIMSEMLLSHRYSVHWHSCSCNICNNYKLIKSLTNMFNPASNSVALNIIASLFLNTNCYYFWTHMWPFISINSWITLQKYF